VRCGVAASALEATPQQAADCGGRVAGESVEVDLRLEHGGQDVADHLSVEQPAADEHLVEHDPEGPDVGASIRRLALRLLGRHVGRRPQNLAAHRRRQGQRR